MSDISRDGYQLAQDISSYSLIAVSKYAQPFLAPNSGIVSMTYLGSERAIPNYNMMGIAKASLEAAIRYWQLSSRLKEFGSMESQLGQSKH